MDVNNVDRNFGVAATSSKTKKKSGMLDLGNPSTSNDLSNTSTTKIGHDFDPEKRKSPSKRRSIVKLKRKPQAQGYYRRRLEYFDKKQNGTKEEVANFSEAAAQGLDMIPSVMDGQMHPQHLFPFYHKAINSYLEASLKLRQTILTERKLAAEVWGDNSIASYDNGIYTVQKDIIEDLLRPKTEEVKAPSRKVAPRKRKQSPQETVKEAVVQSDPDVDSYDITDFLEFSDNMAITRSKTKAIRQQVEIKVEPSPPPPPVAAPPVVPSKGKRKTTASNAKEVPPTKRTRFAKDSSKTPTPPPSSLPPPPPKGLKKNVVNVKETPMPSFKLITENKVTRRAEEIIKDTKVLQCYCKADAACNDSCVNRILHMECGSRCPVGENCQNKRFQKLQYASFEPFFAGIKGWGIRATKPIHKGNFIVEYVGDVVDAFEMTKRQQRYTKNNHKHHYMMSLRNGAVIDATTSGNYSRFVNHSCDPNAETQKWVVSRQIRIGFFAKKDIAQGEEIVFDYAFERFGKDAQECFCGSDNCTGFIGSRPEEGDNDEEEADSSESTSEATDEETTQEATNVVKKAPKQKRTAEEKELRKRMAKARRKLVKARREFRKVIGRKKNFSADDVLEFNRQMYRINDYDQRFLIINFLLSFPDEQWKKNFIENNGIEVVWSWLTDYTGSVSLKTFVRLQNGLIKFLDTLPVEFNDHLKSIVILLKDLKDVQLPDDIILQETLNELVDCVVSDEPEIADKDLARMMDRDKVSMIKLYDETVGICKRLYDAWSQLPSLLTEGCVDISGDEMDESRIAVVELPSDQPVIIENASQPEDSPEIMDTDFDTPEHISQPENEIDIGAKKHFGSSPSSSPADDHRSEKENSQGKKFRSRSRSRSTPPRRRRSRSRSPIGFKSFLHNAVKKDYRYHDDRRKSDRYGYYRSHDDRRDRRYEDDHYRNKRINDRYSDRYRSDRHYDNRRYEERRHDRYRDRDDRHNDSRHRSTRHHDHRSERHSHSHRHTSVSHESRKHRSKTPDTTKSLRVTRKESPAREHHSKSVFAKTIKIEIPETSPVIKSESPPEISPAVTTAVSSVVSQITNAPAAASKSNSHEVPYESVFPDAPKPVPPPSTELTTLFSTPPPELPGMGPKFKSTMQFQGFATTRPVRPQPIRFAGFRNSTFRPRYVRPVRLPIVVPPPPVMPPQFLQQSSQQQWYGYPQIYCPVPPPPPPSFENHTQTQVPQPLQIPLPVETTVPDPQPSYEVSKQPAASTQEFYETSVVTSSKEIKREELSPVVSDPTQSNSTPEEPEEVEKSKLKPYDKNPDWIETFTDDGIVYYYHKETRETSWDEPPPKLSEKVKPVFQQSKTVNRSENVLSQHHINDLELKKQFKLKIWQNLHKYLKPRSEMKAVDEGTLTQFARKMTHRCLDTELRNGNNNLEITEKVYLRARQITDQHYAQFVAETRTIKTEPIH